MSQSDTLQYVFTPSCRELIQKLDLAEETVLEAYHKRDDTMLVPAAPPHMYSIRWTGEGEGLFVSSSCSKMEWQVDRARPSEISINLALPLRRVLPAGSICPRMKMDQIWTLVAESFGVPVCFQEDLGYHRRYTGRWHGEDPRWEETGIDGDEYFIDGVLEQKKDNVKYAWVLSLATYLKWWKEKPFGGTAAEPSDEEIDVDAVPRLLFAKMRPAKLTRPIIIRADIGEAAVRLLSTHCTMRELDDPPHFHPKMKCLHVFGAEILDPENIPKQLAGKEYVVPTDFVTDIRTGPEIHLTGGEAPQRSGVLPTGYKPGNKMGLRSITSLLADLTAPE